MPDDAGSGFLRRCFASGRWPGKLSYLKLSVSFADGAKCRPKFKRRRFHE